MNDLKRVLVLAPHTDDAELGCGGTISRFVQENINVYVAAFSTANESLPAGCKPNLLKEEFAQAMRTLDVPEEHIITYDYPVRRLSYYRQEVLEDLVQLRRSIEPDMVFIPSIRDVHQDHQVLHNEGVRAFKDITVWGYELPWNHFTFSAQAFIRLEERHIEAKWQALQVYLSQIQKELPYFTKDFIRSLATIRGVQVKAKFAECFEVKRIRF
jgi:LmbE family N-acetylglucosaminyl deacetylase